MPKKVLQPELLPITIERYEGNLRVGCHVSAAGGVFNSPKNAYDLKCETFQIFTRPPQGGPAAKLTPEVTGQFKEEMKKYGYKEFVVHCPYFVNFGSAEPRIFH